VRCLVNARRLLYRATGRYEKIVNAGKKINRRRIAGLRNVKT
jgi:hypothetical protein